MKIYGLKIADIKEENLAKICLAINSDKIHEIKKFKHKNDIIRTVIGELLVRRIAAKELEIKKEYISFDKNPYGKPYLKEYPEFNFNIAHSGNFVVCAVDDKSIGIDIEEVKYIEYESIAKNFFTASEFDYIIKNDLDAQLSTFYEIWTLKESYIKCCGKGLSIPLNSFSIDIDEYDNIKNIVDDKNDLYSFKRINIESDYKMAVCSLKKYISSDIIIIDQNILINDYIHV